MTYDVVIKYGYEVVASNKDEAKLKAYLEHIRELHEEGPVRPIIDVEGETRK